MGNLREMVDGFCSLQINASAVANEVVFKPQDEFVLRRKVNRTGPLTSEVLVGRILAMHDNGTADASIMKAGGVSIRTVVNLKDIQPVTDKFRRSSIQFSPAYRPRA